MGINLNHFITTILIAVSLAACATGDPSDDLNFDYSQANTSHFNGYWEGRVNCSYTSRFEPLPWVRITDGRGEFGFGKGKAGIGYSLETLHSDFDSTNGRISWSGKLVPWGSAEKMRVSFKGQWQDKKFKLKGNIARQSCTGALNKI